MHISRIHVGGWFQRTRLHLGELYDFFRDAESPLNLEVTTLKTLRSALKIRDLDMVTGQLEYIEINTEDDLTIKIFEDGLVVLNAEHTGDLKHDIERLTTFYEEKLSPAFSYVFSLGAPVPKELANIKTVYPYFISVGDATPEDIENTFADFNETPYLSVSEKEFQIYRGDKLYIINQSGVTHDDVQRFVEEQIFLREFKGQLHRYLNLHRIIWEQIADVKERGSMRGFEIPSFKTKVDQYQKTISFIDTRIQQMDTYLATRESIAAGESRLDHFRSLLAFRHEKLADNLEYITDLWDLTSRYVDSAAKLFSDLQASATNTSVQKLTVVTSMGVGATLIGLFTKDAVPSISLFGIGYFLALAVIGYSVNRFMSWWARRKTYSVRDTELADF